jgi:hypothetical protein
LLGKELDLQQALHAYPTLFSGAEEDRDRSRAVAIDQVRVDLAVLPCDFHPIGSPCGFVALRADRDLRAHT